jgi:hypothetical protein
MMRQVCIDDAQMSVGEVNLFLQNGQRLLQKNRKRSSTLRTFVRFVSQSHAEPVAPPAAVSAAAEEGASRYTFICVLIHCCVL